MSEETLQPNPYEQALAGFEEFSNLEPDQYSHLGLQLVVMRISEAGAQMGMSPLTLHSKLVEVYGRAATIASDHDDATGASVFQSMENTSRVTVDALKPPTPARGRGRQPSTTSAIRPSTGRAAG